MTDQERENHSRLPLPHPDPTVLTTQQLQREVSAIKELFSSRLDAMDKAIVLLQNTVDKSPSIAVVDERVNALDKLYTEKFRSVDARFTTTEKHAEAQARDSKTAVDAALQAAKEAAQKNETSTTKQIDQMALLNQTNNNALNDKIDDLKTRQAAGEGNKKGIADGWGMLVGVLGLIAAIAIVVVTAMQR